MSTTTTSRFTSTWTCPADLRERMHAATIKGTNLDPNGDTRDHSNTIEAQQEQAREYARLARRAGKGKP